jgi:hypothetical protein
MKQILVISPGQFGSHVGTFQYCILLSKEYLVTYLGYNEGLPHVDTYNVNVIHLESKKNVLFNKIYFIMSLIFLLKKTHFEFHLVNYFLGCSMIRLFIRKKIVVDIRSSYIFQSRSKRYIYNFLLTLEVKAFSNITVISKNLSSYLKLPKRAHHVPLGSPIFPDWEKSYSSFKILYVGTFFQREIDEAIKGFSQFYSEFKDLINIELNIIGYGSAQDIQKIKTVILDLNLSSVVKYWGSIRYPELNHHFKANNIGLSYIPITEYFNFQPPTKTFEYLSSGMITIATATAENEVVIDDNNGILIIDNKEGLYKGLKYIYENRVRFNSLEIQNKSRQFSWNNIVYSNLIPYLNSID